MQKHEVSLWNRVVLARIFLSQRWLLSMTNVLLHPYLPGVMQRRRREDGTPKHLRYLQNVSEDHHLLLAEVTDVSDYLHLLWHSISGEHQHSYFSSFSSIMY
ncbi:hypothetical protein DAPPUDRAFT_239028 [Daphnia pulex]|uniref:Uncharacterized protein n=1 Tax=Daphnia pulex TaxID=6669 RepID=E9G855_DAPPU|nr:hypothetical protein DAPPUDRAFT_239028 [Daphnia pulex]|eukprot:EFX83917.1 hypothetical protein DAPPUDRAFT_239028 [Daphnia pulex]